MDVKIQVEVFWDVTTCSVVGYQPCCPCHFEDGGSKIL